MSDLYQQAVESFKAGDKKKAKSLLEELLKSKPNHADALYGLSMCSDTYDERKAFLERVLAINPNYPKAKETLDKLIAEQPRVNIPSQSPEPNSQPKIKEEVSPTIRNNPLRQGNQTGIEFIPAICPQCGGELHVPNDRNVVKCMYCGYDIIIHEIKNNPPQPGVENWMKLASTIGDTNPQEGYQYYSRVLEYEPENSLAWFGKGHCVGKLSTLYHPTAAEMMACFLKSVEFVDKELKAGRIRAILLNSRKLYWRILFFSLQKLQKE